MPTKEKTGQALDAAALFARYHQSWTAKDPDLIASLHSDDTLFAIHDGSTPVKGREPLRQLCAAMFEKYRFSLEEKRTLFGPGHWIMEWDMVIDVADAGGRPTATRVGMLDVVTFDGQGKVTRKDVFVNGAEMKAAMSAAGTQPAAATA